MAVSSNNALGKYRILREIARSNDVVYEAVDSAMGRRVAIKELLLPSHLSGVQKRERIERFYREAKAAGTLSHPNIVTIHEVGQDNDRHFIAMEYLEGQSLRDILQMRGALPLKDSLEIILQLCEALGYAHARGVVHRDIKPDNVHVLPNGTVKLTDFGIARLAAEPGITSQGQVFGTPSYMSPEQVASRTVDHRTDLFSLGVTLYEILAGRKPFLGDSVITITYNIMNAQPPMPVGVPPVLHGILQKALAKDANLRYQTAAAMAADLRAEKYALETPYAANRTGQWIPPAPISGGPAMLDTGAVPPEISGIPSSVGPGGQYVPGGQYTPPPVSGMGSGSYDAVPDYTYPRRSGGLSPQARSFLGLLFSVAALIGLVLVIVWGVNAAFRSYQTKNKEAYAAHLYNQATQDYNSGAYAQAEREFEAARQAAPTNTPQARRAAQSQSASATAQGQQAAQANDPAAAQQAYQRAVSLDSHNAAAYNDLGNQKSQQGDWQGAVQAWEEAVRADPSSQEAAQARSSAEKVYQNWAQQAYTAGNMEQARTWWQRIITLDPGSDAALQAQQRISSTPLSSSYGAGNSSPTLGSGQ